MNNIMQLLLPVMRSLSQISFINHKIKLDFIYNFRARCRKLQWNDEWRILASYYIVKCLDNAGIEALACKDCAREFWLCLCVRLPLDNT